LTSFDLFIFKLRKFQFYSFKEQKIEATTIFKMLFHIFLTAMKKHWNCGGKALLGDNTGGMVALLSPISFQCLYPKHMSVGDRLIQNRPAACHYLKSF